jgi:hypothetical protein
MPHDENQPLLKAFNRLGLAIGFRANAASFSSYTAALEDQSRIVEWDRIQEAAAGGIFRITHEDHFNGCGETEDMALAGLKKRFQQTSVNDTCLLIKTSESATGARYLAVKSDGGDGVKNMGYVVTERADTGNRIREFSLKR